ncbi:hypothetical protein pb186bvf_015591 [Paramecium bursaria]
MNINEGVQSFKGNVSLYKSLLIQFNQITLEDLVIDLYQHIKDGNHKLIQNCLKQMLESTKINKCYLIEDQTVIFLRFLDRFGPSNQNFPFLIEDQFRQLIRIIIQTKKDIQEYTSQTLDFRTVNLILFEINQTSEVKTSPITRSLIPITHQTHKLEDNPLMNTAQNQNNPYIKKTNTIPVQEQQKECCILF